MSQGVSTKHRIRLILKGEDGDHTVAIYVPTLEQTSILTFLFRRCLLYPSFDLIHDIFNRSSGFNTIGKPYSIQSEHEVFEELKKSRESKGVYRVIVGGVQDVLGKDIQDLVLYLTDPLDVCILTALVMERFQFVNKTVTVEERDRKTGEWNRRDLTDFVPQLHS